MPKRPSIRPVVPADVAALKTLVDTTLFPADLLDDMIAPYLAGSSDIWLTHERDGLPVAVAFCEAERMTEGTWNLLAIAVLPVRQGAGVGAALVRHLEFLLAARGERILIVETSGLPAYDGARRFYARLGFAEEARIRDFYAAGDDKVVFRKALAAAG